MPGPVDVLQGTTPTLLIPIAGEDWTQCTVYLAIEMRGKVINRKSDTLLVSYAEGTTTIAVLFSQEETLQMTPGEANGEVKAISSDGNTMGTYTFHFKVLRTLIPFVVTFEGVSVNGGQ